MAKDDANRPAQREGTQLVKASEKRPARAAEQQLVEKINASVGKDVVASFAKSREISFYHETKVIQDMTPENAAAVVEKARLESAVPEQERSRRSRHQTIRLSIMVAAVVFFGILAYNKPEAGGVFVGLAVIPGGGIVFTEFINREKRKDSSSHKNGRLSLP